MKYKIRSYEKLKRNRWFTNEEFGISIQYEWLVDTAELSLDSNFLMDECDEDLNDFIEPLINPSEGESSPDEIDIDYPAPWFLNNPEKSAIWVLPPFKKKLASDFKISIALNYITDKAIQLEKQKLPNRWTTNDSAFKWDINNVKPLISQSVSEYEVIATVWASNAWQSEKDLNDFMLKAFEMEIEDDVVTMYIPTLEVD